MCASVPWRLALAVARYQVFIGCPSCGKCFPAILANSSLLIESGGYATGTCLAGPHELRGLSPECVPKILLLQFPLGYAPGTGCFGPKHHM